jgi:hypothetical protein
MYKWRYHDGWGTKPHAWRVNNTSVAMLGSDSG